MNQPSTPQPPSALQAINRASVRAEVRRAMAIIARGSAWELSLRIEIENTVACGLLNLETQAATAGRRI